MGGKDIYDKKYFNAEGITLSFLSPNPIKYSADYGNQKLNADLSILDLIMRESPFYINELLEDYQLI